MTLKNWGVGKKGLRGGQCQKEPGVIVWQWVPAVAVLGFRGSKIGGSKKRLRGGQCRKAGAVVWQWVPTFKEAVPPPPPRGITLCASRPFGSVQIAILLPDV